MLHQRRYALHFSFDREHRETPISRNDKQDNAIRCPIAATGERLQRVESTHSSAVMARQAPTGQKNGPYSHLKPSQEADIRSAR